MLILLSAALLLLASCTNDIKAPDDSWENVFLQYWNAMNTEYVHFDTDSDLDWDRVYDEYLPRFQALDYTIQTDSLTAFKYFKEISLKVDDYHYSLTVKDGFGSCLKISPALERKWYEGEQKNPTEGTEDNPYTIMSFPDITWVDSLYGITYLKSVDTRVTVTSSGTSQQKYIEMLDKVEGVLETQKLASVFHKASYKAWEGYTFDISAPTAATTNPADIAAYSVVSALALSGVEYYYGVTDDDIFYFYISSFAGTPLEEEMDLVYTKDLDEEEREKLHMKSLLQLHDLMWCIDESTGKPVPSDSDYYYDLTKYEVTVTDKSTGTTSTEEVNLIEKLEGVYNLYKALQSIGKGDKCEIKGTECPVKGVVMDVRSNGGGAVYTLEKIFGCFFKEETVFAKSRYKDGYSRLEYSPWVDFKIEDIYCNGIRDYDKPFAIITNGFSVSCSELSASIVQNLFQNGAVIGSQTYGGTCGLTDRNIYHSGPFTSNSLSIYTTTYETELRMKDGSYVNLEGKGITPDEIVDTATDFSTDTRFEAAVKWVKDRIQ